MKGYRTYKRYMLYYIGNGCIAQAQSLLRAKDHYLEKDIRTVKIKWKTTAF